jgi:hypothetical protein
MSEILLPHLNRANYLYSTGGENGTDRRQAHIGDDSSQRVIGELGRLSRELAEVPHDETGLDLQRVAGFLDEHGLAMKPFMAVDEAGQHSIDEIIDYTPPPKIQTLGSYMPLLDFTYVLRGSHETANGPIATEACVVHEIAHANQPYWDILSFEREDVVSGIGYCLMRNGFTSHEEDEAQGNFFEEGFAALMQHKYITRALGSTDGFLGSSEPQKLNLNPDAAYLLPGCYLYKSTETSAPQWHTSAHAAYGMQLLIAKDPALFPAMLAARKGSGGLHEFARRVDALDSGLHGVLNAKPYSEMRFLEAAHSIVDRLYGGDPEKALAAAAEQDFRELASSKL